MNRADRRDQARRLRKSGLPKQYADLMARTESTLLLAGVRTDLAHDLAWRDTRRRWAVQRGHITPTEYRQRALVDIATIRDRAPRIVMARRITALLNAEAQATLAA